LLSKHSFLLGVESEVQKSNSVKCY